MTLLRFTAVQPQDLCVRCCAPFSKHFKPGAGADKTLAANWCPNMDRTGFTSQTFRKATQ
jgi:hypothetical protein